MNHYSNKCDVITEDNLRKEKLRELRCCYKCTKKEHIANHCLRKVFVIDVKYRIDITWQYVVKN